MTALAPRVALRRRTGEAERRWPLARIFTVGATIAGLVAVGCVALGAFALLRLGSARTTLLDVVGPRSRSRT